MKNSELFKVDPKLLGSLDRQRRYLVEMFAYPVPCPNQGCRKPVNVFEAMGIDIDDYDFTGRDYDLTQTYKCPHCHYALRKVVPLFKVSEPGHHWEIAEPLPPKEDK